MANANFRFGMDVLPLLYDTMQGADEAFFRTAANNGVVSMRWFINRKDAMSRGDYGPAFWKRFTAAMTYCKQYNIRPILVAGYYRANRAAWNHADWIWLIDQIVDRAEAILPGGWDLSPLNEPAQEPKLFGFTDGTKYSTGKKLATYVYRKVVGIWKTGDRAHMLALGAWYAWLRDHLAEKGFPMERVIGCVQFDDRYDSNPALYPSTSDMIAGGLDGELDGWTESEISAAKRKLKIEVHGVTLLADLFHVRRFWSMLARPRIVWQYFVTNDGESSGNPTGKYVTHPTTGKPVFRSSSAAELKTLLAALDRIASEGINANKFSLESGAEMTLGRLCSGSRRYAVSILYHDLPREVFTEYDAAKGWSFDVREINWKRIREALPAWYRLKYCDRFEDPEPVEPEPDPEPEPEETEPTPAVETEETVSDESAWKHLVPAVRVGVDFNGFWKAANLGERIVGCIAAPIALALCGLAVWGLAELIAWIF